MRSASIIILTAVSAAFAINLADAAPNPADLLAYYKFDETSGTTVSDETGDYDGTINISNAWHTGGKYGGCIQCGPNHAEVVVPASLFIQ